MTTPTTWQLQPNSATTNTNRPITASTKLIRSVPRFHDLTDPDEYVAALAGAVAAEHPQPAVDLHNPQLTRGQAQVLRAETPRLFRLLSRRSDPRAIPAAVLLLEDLAEQAPAVDDALALEDERRRAALAGRPRLATVLSKRGES
jgi:hypothetical protein